MLFSDRDRLRDGLNTQTQQHSRIQNLDESPNQANGRKNGDVNTERCLQETWDWYDKCYNRERNAGEFILINKPQHNMQYQPQWPMTIPYKPL